MKSLSWTQKVNCKLRYIGGPCFMQISLLPFFKTFQKYLDNVILGLIPIRDRLFKMSANFHDFWPLPPTVGSFFTTIGRQIWQIFYTSAKTLDTLTIITPS